MVELPQRIAVVFLSFCVVFFSVRFAGGCATGETVPSQHTAETPDASLPTGTDGGPDSSPARPPFDSGTYPPMYSDPFDSGSFLDAGSSSDVLFDASLAPCVPTGSEICDGKDNDCDGKIDEDFLCKLGATDGPLCVTSCGSAGQRICEAPACSWGACKPFPENCSNTIDDDCNGLIDCLDPACASSPDCTSKPDAGTVTGLPDASCFTTVKFSYAGPSSPGFVWIDAWWKNADGTVRPWSKIAECVDTTSGDGKLDCAFNISCGASSFEFQVYLPDGRYWGDKSYATTGGKGATVGTVTLATPKGPLAFTMIPNPWGDPYYNGFVSSIP